MDRNDCHAGRTTIILTLVLLSVLMSTCIEEEQQQFGDLNGIVTNEFGQPLEGAQVKAGTLVRTTLAGGNYYFKDIPAGTYQVSAEKPSYLPLVKDAMVTDGKETILDFSLSAGEPSLWLSDTLMTASHNPAYGEITVFANATWQVEVQPGWLSCSVSGGQGNKAVKISWIAYDGVESRAGDVIFRMGTIVRTLHVTQHASLKLMVNKAYLGNGVAGIPDSVYLRFNKPVTVKQIINEDNTCICEIGYTMKDQGYGLMFSYSCGRFGISFPVRVHVEASDGTKFNEIIQASFFDKTIPFEGRITDIFYLPDLKSCWIAQQEPNSLVRISAGEMMVEKEIPLDFKPRGVVLNPYNQLLYVIGGDPGHNQFDSTVYIFHPESGNLLKKVVIHPEEGGHPNYPTIFPYEIGFTNSGYGLILLQQDGASGLDWRILDSSHGDTVYFHDQNGFGTGLYQYFETIHTDHTGDHLLLTGPYHDHDIYRLDGSSHLISQLVVEMMSSGVFITPSRLSSRIYCGQLYAQFIMDPEGFMSSVSHFDNRNRGNADFCNLPGEEDVVYFVDMDYFYVLDYGLGATVMDCPTFFGFSFLTSSLDGKYVFSCRTGDFVSDFGFFRFEASDFWRYIEK